MDLILPAASASYGDALFEGIILMKYEEVTRLGNCFAFRLAGIDDLPGRVGARSSPLHRGLRRKGERGQAELIARPVARRLASAKN